MIRQKQRQKRLTDEEALTIVRAWHSREMTQVQLAEKYGITAGHVSRICHGEFRPQALEAYRRELARSE